MIVDAELGMPLELGNDDPGYWEGDRSRIAPELFGSRSQEMLDDEDLELLVDPPPATASSSAASTLLLQSTGIAPGTPSAARSKQPGVEWLRRTEYSATLTKSATPDSKR